MALHNSFSEHPIYKFLEVLSARVKNKKIAALLYEPDVARVIDKIIYWNGNHGHGVRVSQRTIAHHTGLGLKRVRTILKLLARFSILRVVAPYLVDGSKRRDTSQIDFHPAIRDYLAGRVYLGQKDTTKFVSYCIAAHDHRDDSESDLQGFGVSVLYLEPEPGQNLKLASDEGAAAGGNDLPVKGPEHTLESTNATVVVSEMPKSPIDALWLDKAALTRDQKKRDDFTWRELGRKFVTGAAVAWTTSQVALGNPEQIPAWEGEPNHLSATNLKAYKELVKVFQTEGGYRATLGWYAYCAGKTQYDKNKRPIFDPKAPHRQWRSDDKQPGSFAKYFNAIMADPVTAHFAKHEGVTKYILTTFGERVVRAEPRWQKAATTAYANQTTK